MKATPAQRVAQATQSTTTTVTPPAQALTAAALATALAARLHTTSQVAAEQANRDYNWQG